MFVISFPCNSFGNFFKLVCRQHRYPTPINCNFWRHSTSSSHSSTWESVVGLEIHAQINAKSKLFSNSAALFNEPTNSQVTYFDAALPGTLPVLNRYCIEAGVLTALALNCKIHKTSAFDRKHYFYPDLPAGYQITQQFKPLASDGYLKFSVYDTFHKNILYNCCANLKQVQLEQDSGRSFHVEGQRSLVDLNRAGIGLMELVFEPNLKNGTEAAALVNELILVLKCIGVCTCEMEEGALRVDANISVNRIGEPFGVRTEVKNINSLRYIARAVDYEIDRQIKVLDSGGFVSNETRSFDYSKKETIFMRDKETLQDYRYMPEPNLPPIVLYDDTDSDISGKEDIINIDDLRRKLPSLPSAEREKLKAKYNISYEAIDRLLTTEGARHIFEEIVHCIQDKDILLSFLFFSVQRQLKIRKLSFHQCPFTSQNLSDLVQLLEKRKISEATANDILEMLFNGDQRKATDIVEKYNWYQILEGEELEKLCQEAMKARPKMVQKYRRTKKLRYMTSLLSGLNEIANNRANINDAEKVFKRLMGVENGVEKEIVSEINQQKKTEDPE